MRRLTRAAVNGAAACSAAALLVSCTQVSSVTPPARQPEPAASPSTDPALPTAQEHGGTDLPLVAGQWGGDRHKAPPQHLRWDTAKNRRTDAEQPFKVTVTAAAAPSYVSFMLHSTIDESGIPDEDTRRQKILACGPGITDPGCRTTDNEDGSYTVEVIGTPPPGRPYRVLYAQWAPNRPGAEGTWVSWQLPLG
ncbi:hypothetical protein GCM10010145_48530 [Streptomyces ruber]|uniref:Lipoprotein n=2 Tax=Streptomyces TaxID=1883 RepID=A0A918BJ61_9ACTN|nr:hypothetical protein [Streptomyces ruber]GGQ73095.1 hypothetical protein GCM10010145_48530 [Streptomyces ruber]